MEELLKQILAEQQKTNQRLGHIENDISGLKDDVSTLKDDVSGLKDDVSTLKDDVSGLKDDVSTLKDDVSGLKDDVSTLKDDVSGLKDDVSTLNSCLSNVEAQLDENTQIIKAIRHSQEYSMAKLDSLETTTAKSDAMIKLDSKFTVLNKRLFDQEVEIQTLK